MEGRKRGDISARGRREETYDDVVHSCICKCVQMLRLERGKRREREEVVQV